MAQDKIDWEILEDGTISVKTPGISGTNHVSADQLLKQIAAMAGGEHKKTKRLDRFAVNPLHDALHQHSADGHTH